VSRAPSKPPAIGDYAIIGDCRSAALVSRDGSIDWLCWPRFDSPSLFAALLDPALGGRFAVRPAGRYRATRRYLGDTAVLETTFRSDHGTVRLVDLMPVCGEDDKGRLLIPDHEILRVIECTEGEMALEVVYDPRPDYARRRPRMRDRGALGFYAEHRGQVLILRGDLPLEITDEGSGVRGRVSLRAGERRHLSLVFSDGEPAVLPPLGQESQRTLRRSLDWWEGWTGRCRYAGPFREPVIRSALTLKLMAYAPSGAVVAAPTTSLPEQLGGMRNWDYRYCWLRDASLTLQALFDLGYPEEAEAFMSWLLHTTRITRPELQVLYTVFGEAHLPERELPHLAGFAGSRPVRIGNDAHGQLQLDIYGEVMDAAYEFASRGGTVDRVTATLLTGFGRAVCRRWREPDDGIWEFRRGRQHHTHSKVMCWVALDRLVRLHEEGHLRAPAADFVPVRDRIRREVERRGYDEAAGTFVSVLDGDQVDAVLLLLSRYGFVEPTDPSMLRTCMRIERDLGVGGLLRRYPPASDGLPGDEGAFGICSFWWVATRAAQGDLEEATRAFEHLLRFGNDVGLFAEEIEPATGTPLGNFPQAFTHVGLIDAALTLEHASGTRTRRLGTERVQQTGAHL
jgi:GH15 family glucan-1,4-alpha-glucosidase